MARNVGGRIEISLSGVVVNPVADVQVEETSFETETQVNQDGTIGRSVKPKPFRVEVSLRASPSLDLNALMSSTFDASFYERDLGRSFLLTGAFFEGNPKRNTTSGEISGLSIVSDQYRRV